MKTLIVAIGVTSLVVQAGNVRAGTITLDFGDATINARPSGVDATAYLAANNVFITSITSGTTYKIRDDRDIYGGSTAIPSSLHNYVWQEGSNDPVSVELTFGNPVKDVSFYRIGSSNSATTPEWSVHVFNGLTELTSTGESLNGFFQQPPKLFSFNASSFGASQITKIRFDSNNYNFAAYSSVGIDDLSFTPIPEPTSLALCVLGALGLVGYRRRQWQKRRRNVA